MAFPFSVMAPISSTDLFWIPLLEIFHLVRSPNWQSAITGTGRDSFHTISSTGLCHFRCGQSLGPIPELDSMRMVSFPVQGSSRSSTVVVRVQYLNWTLCVWSHFWYRALPVQVGSFLGFRPELNNMHGGYAHWWVCGKCAHDDCDGAMGDGLRATKSTTLATE